ncbi:hypothetical protein [Salinarimonas rosea]|uniref:hypothetical protein n=1 Tax=Salinarimonas rosea TaxID=552063 RepID=UPI000411EC7A|nr:hypothetical protein [Salinarimonas rosea]
MYAIVRGTSVQTLQHGPFVDAGGVLHPVEALTHWSDAERLAVGVYPIVDDAVPAGERATGWSLELDGDVVRRRWTTEAYTPPPAPVPDSVTPRQLMLGLAAAGWITAAEAEAWAQRTGLPATMLAVIGQLPPDQALSARVTAYTMSAAYRSDPLLRAAAVVAMPGSTDAEIDAALDDAFRAWSVL